ncbi:ABC transporter substrate-binding protein [Bacillus marasmi]|uniref:ABC transporter substrate-binding protein n=1 Tax=Bacillus marasmi TaxID=1926279 RepID=UPI0011CBA194|nr:ABC transporter substrate-binding protein [Bacillus marasmi]
MKKWILACISVMLAFVMTACGAKQQEGVSKDEKSEDLSQIDIMLDWYPNAVHSFLYVAEEKGYFKEEGVKVNIQFPANPTDPLNLAAAGKITIGLYYQPDVIMARTNEDIPVKSIGAIVRSPLNSAVFLKDSSIHSPKDLEGKTVGYPGTPLNEVYLAEMIKHDGGNPDKVKLVDVGFELVSTLATKKTDAVIGAYVNHEVPILNAKGSKVDYFDPTQYGVPSYYELVAVTGDKTWEKEQAEIKAFWRAASKGYEFMKKNPDEALAILLKYQDETNYPLDEKIEKESLEILLPKMESEAGFGSQTEESWQETANWFKDKGLLNKTAQIDGMFVNLVE